VDKTNALCCKGASLDLFWDQCVAPRWGCDDEMVDEMIVATQNENEGMW